MAIVSIRIVHISKSIIPRSINQEIQQSGMFIVSCELYSLSSTLLSSVKPPGIYVVILIIVVVVAAAKKGS